MKLEDIFKIENGKYLIEFNRKLNTSSYDLNTLPEELKIIGIFYSSKEFMLEGLKRVDPSKHKISHWPSETFVELLFEWPSLAKKYILASYIPSIAASTIISNANGRDCEGMLPSIEEDPTMLVIWEKLPINYLSKYKTMIFKYAIGGDKLCEKIVENKFKEKIKEEK